MKTYVEIIAQHDKTGNIHPLIMHWPDGRKFEIDKIMDVRQAPSMVRGGHGMKYTCRIRNNELYLFQEGMDGKWFIEK